MGVLSWIDRNLTVRRGVLGLVLLAGLVYVSALGGAFIWDDEYLFLDNPLLLKETVNSAFILDPLRFQPGKIAYHVYRPLQILTYSWMARIFGLQPFGMHFASVAVHAAAGVLVFFLVLQFAEIRVAWVAAALFLVHPLHVEAVAWISAFSEVLAGALMLLSLYTLLRARQGPDAAPVPLVQRRCLLAISYLAAAMAFLTKETAMALPLVASVFVGWRAWPYFAIAGGAVVLRFTAYGFAAASLPSRTTFEHLRIFWAATFQYVKKMIWPWPLALEYDLRHPPLIWIALAAVCALAVWLACRKREARLALLLFVIPLSPALASSVFLPFLREAQDRYAYVAVLGFALLIGYAARHRAGFAAALALVMLWSALSVVALVRWRDPEALWTNTLRVTPKSKTAVSQLGYWYFSTMRFADAERIYEQGLVLRPKDGDFLASRDAVRKVLSRTRSSP